GERMRLATIAINGQARAAVFADGAYVDVQATDGQLPGSVRQIIAGGAPVLDAVARAVRRPNAVKHAAGHVKLLAPILDPPKIVCLGLNYRDHAADGGAPIAKEPILFTKCTKA